MKLATARKNENLEFDGFGHCEAHHKRYFQRELPVATSILLNLRYNRIDKILKQSENLGIVDTL